jgi:pilus assembly protein Flp/PilA
MTSLTQFQSRMLSALGRDDKGATAVEYGLIIALIATVIALAVTGLGTTVATAFGNIHF